MSRRVRVFHISDLHGRSEDGPNGERARREAPMRWRVIRKEWDRNLEALREDGVPVDLVVFTGDLGDWGHETDYKMGVDLLRRTCQALEVPIERLFAVPGNHDIARETEEPVWKAMRAQLARASLPVSLWMAGGQAPPGLEDRWRDAVLRRQANFWNAMLELGRADLGPWRHRHGRLGYQVPVNIDGLAVPLWVIGLDTAWLAGDDADTGSLRLTDHQIELLTSGRDGADLVGPRLVLMHHRFADLADGERARRLLADRVDIVMHGHQHEAAVESWASPDHGLLVLAAGCLYEGDEHHRYPNACQMVDLELDDDNRLQRVVIRFRGWAERNGLFWGDDGLLYKSARQGRLALRRTQHAWSIDDRYAASAPTVIETHIAEVRTEFTTLMRMDLSEEPRVSAQLKRIEGAVDELHRIQPDNGHALYYSGELKRWRGQRDRLGLDYLRSHEDFVRYLARARTSTLDTPPLYEVDADVEACYHRVSGFGLGRTAWILHLMCNDFCRCAESGRFENMKSALENKAFAFSAACLRIFPPGFASPTQHRPTLDVFRTCARRLQLSADPMLAPILYGY